MSESNEGVVEGYLLLADISGYTTFLTGTELEHSHAIVTELTRAIRAALCPPMQFVKLEGDAVFCFARQAAFPTGGSAPSSCHCMGPRALDPRHVGRPDAPPHRRRRSDVRTRRTVI